MLKARLPGVSRTRRNGQLEPRNLRQGENGTRRGNNRDERRPGRYVFADPKVLAASYSFWCCELIPTPNAEGDNLINFYYRPAMTSARPCGYNQIVSTLVLAKKYWLRYYRGGAGYVNLRIGQSCLRSTTTATYTYNRGFVGRTGDNTHTPSFDASMRSAAFTCPCTLLHVCVPTTRSSRSMRK